MRAALYARVSTDKQAEKYGIPSQIEALRKRSLERDWTLALDGDKDAFVDDGYSGAELDRPALNRLRQVAREGRVDVVLAYDPDRLSRKLYHQMILSEEFEKQRIKLEFITQGMGEGDSVNSALSSVSRPVLANAFGLAIGLSILFFSPLRIHMQVASVMWVAMVVSSMAALLLIPIFYARARPRKE